MRARSTFRHADWTVAQDPYACPEYSAECHEPGCEAEFSIKGSHEARDQWMCDHMARTGHRNVWETNGRLVVVSPPPGSLVAHQLAERERAVERHEAHSRPALESARSTAP